MKAKTFYFIAIIPIGAFTVWLINAIATDTRFSLVSRIIDSITVWACFIILAFAISVLSKVWFKPYKLTLSKAIDKTIEEMH